MKRWPAVVALTLALGLGACGSLGLGEADCASPGRDVSSSNILTVQAVPTAKYTPCFAELRPGWDSVAWSAEDGRAGIEVLRSAHAFLTATVTKSCDVSEATPVESGYLDIERYEAVEFQPIDIDITIVPSGELPLLRARLLGNQLAGVEIDNRPVNFTIDDHMDQSVSSRVNTALSRNEYVWIIDELDAEEGTVELRSNAPAVAGRGIQPEDALDLIEEFVPELFYRGNWYFTFEGGCITYEFDAKGTPAETVAADADDALGFYPAFELREMVKAAGYDVTEYAETLEALAGKMIRQLDALDLQMNTGTETIETARVVLNQALQARAEFQEDLSALNPPDEMAELHHDFVELHARIISAQTAFTARSETATGLEELYESAEGQSYRALDAESVSLCQTLTTKIEATAANAVFADVPWVPGNMQQVVSVTFQCE